MNEGRLRILGALVLTACVSCFGAKPAAAQSKLAPGKLAGVVRDNTGTPQMGASVEVVSESASASARGLLTNTEGVFRGEKLAPGLYTVRVTLAGFLPTLEKHVRISSNFTTVLRVELESMFGALDQLRRAPSSQGVEADDWKWVLRSSASLRPVLEWTDEDNVRGTKALSMDAGMPRPARMLLQLTDGARRVASASNIAPAPATAFAYEQGIGGASRLILAGQMSYDESAPGGGIATVWLPTGTLGAGPHTALVLREAKISPDGPMFRGVRVDQGGAVNFTDRVTLRYGGEYVLVGMGASASALRPRVELTYKLSDDWTGAAIFASLPSGPSPLEAEGQPGGDLASALNELDAFPALLWRNGRPVLQSGYHEELSAERRLGPHSSVEVAGFHDDNRHIAVYGRGGELPSADYFQDYFTNGFAYDGGSSSSWGARVAYRQKLTDDLDLTAVYAFAGALVPGDEIDGGALRDVLRTLPRHSLGANLSAKVPRTHT
ncbi:MAG TPA: carboxypeptidase-like regulatory domain-containing protein, partial [Candidatus Acidoferrales bacterium]|nr:carboxypeptidase-like regulatory domain-containing protein [Candidatus Acidoferrales bacterium]